MPQNLHSLGFHGVLGVRGSPKGRGRNLVLEFGKIAPQELAHFKPPTQYLLCWGFCDAPKSPLFWAGPKKSSVWHLCVKQDIAPPLAPPPKQDSVRPSNEPNQWHTPHVLVLHHVPKAEAGKQCDTSNCDTITINQHGFVVPEGWIFCQQKRARKHSFKPLIIHVSGAPNGAGFCPSTVCFTAVWVREILDDILGCLKELPKIRMEVSHGTTCLHEIRHWPFTSQTPSQARNNNFQGTFDIVRPQR